VLKTLLTIIISLPLLITGCTNTSQSYDSSTVSSDNLSFKKVSLNKVETRTRDATVKIYNSSGGHGSGTYFLYRDYHVVFTAAHVIRGSSSATVVDKNGNKRIGMIVYVDSKIDFAIILIAAFEGIRPIDFSLPNYKPSEKIGKKIIFSGYPGRQSLRTVRGSIAGVEGRHVVVHSTAWKGSSGSCLFDSKGDFVGILFAITAVSNQGSTVLLESMIWVEPHNSIDWKKVSRVIDSLN
jgi:S1-C subfamily serine protease